MLRRFSMNHIDVTMEGELEDIRWQFDGVQARHSVSFNRNTILITAILHNAVFVE